MPYKSVAAAHKAAPGLFSVTPAGAKKPAKVNNLAAVNALARIYDAIKAAGTAKSAAAAAKASFAGSWTHTGGGVWKKKKKKLTKGERKQLGINAEGATMICTGCDSNLPEGTGACPECGEGAVPHTVEKALAEPVSFAATGVLIKAEVRDGRKYVTAVCSDDGPDKQRTVDPKTGTVYVADKIDKAFLQNMADACTGGEIELVDSHMSAFGELGKSVRGWLDETGKYAKLLVEFLLVEGDDRGDKLFDDILKGVNTRTLSVEGGVRTIAKDWMSKLGGWVRRMCSGYLKRIAVLPAGKEANPRTGFVGAMVKSLQDAGEGEIDDGVTKKEQPVYSDAGMGRIGYVYVEGEDEKYDTWAVSPSFRDSLRAVQLKIAMPRYQKLFQRVLEHILEADEDEVPDKRAALKTAVDEYQDEIDALLANGSLTKAEADELRAAGAQFISRSEVGYTEAEEDEQKQGDTGGETADDESGGEATKEGEEMPDEKLEETQETQEEEKLEKAVSPADVAASLGNIRALVNQALVSLKQDAAIPDPENVETAEDLHKALRDIELGAVRVATAADMFEKAFVVGPVLDGGSSAAARAKSRETEQKMDPETPGTAVTKAEGEAAEEAAAAPEADADKPLTVGHFEALMAKDRERNEKASTATAAAAPVSKGLQEGVEQPAAARGGSPTRQRLVAKIEAKRAAAADAQTPLKESDLTDVLTGQ